MRTAVVSLFLSASLSLAGCATYSSLPLPQHAKLVTNANALTVPASTFETPGVHAERVDLGRPLNASAVASLAVLNDPVLSAARAARGVAAAQSYATGLLPWPQLTLGAGQPAPRGAGLSNSWSLSLEQDVATLLQRGPITRAAKASEARVRLDVIWDEWQVAQQARFLYADIEAVTVEREALQPLFELYAVHLKAAQKGAAQHRVPQSVVLTSQADYASLSVQLDTLDSRYHKDMAALRSLLGLAPHAPLKLALDDHPARVDSQSLPQAIAALPHRRPDLMALAATYKEADERLRQAVAAQFPLIAVSLQRGRDTDGIVSNSLSLTLNLPFLNGARGQIAIARATRQALHATYQARLDAAVSEATTLSDQAGDLQKQLAQLKKALGQLPSLAEDTLGRVPFSNLAAEQARRSQILVQIASFQGDLDQTTIALDTLLGMPLNRHARIKSDVSP